MNQCVRAPCDENLENLEMLFKEVVNDCNGNIKCVSILVKLMEKKYYWTSHNIDNIKGTFESCGSSRSKLNHSCVKKCIS